MGGQSRALKNLEEDASHPLSLQEHVSLFGTSLEKTCVASVQLVLQKCVHEDKELKNKKYSRRMLQNLFDESA